jgi:hypothetical protein
MFSAKVNKMEFRKYSFVIVSFLTLIRALPCHYTMIYQVLFVLAALASATATARYNKFNVKKDSVTSSKTVDGTVVGAKVF